MASTPIKTPARNLLISALCVSSVCLCGLAFLILARADNAGQIRSQTDETLVPVLVLDKSLALKFHHMEPDDWRKQVIASGYKMWESVAIANLREADFKLYEDGEEQEIQSVTPEKQDSDQYLASNFGRYWQAAGVGGGGWSIPDWFPLGNDATSTFANSERIYQPIFDSSGNQSNPYVRGRSAPVDVSGLEPPPSLLNLPPLPWYMIAYTRPTSPPGSCHRITVKVDRPDSLIYSRSEYCDASDSAADALADAKLGVRLKAELLSKKKSALPLRITAIPVFTSTGASRIRLFVDAKPDAASVDCNSFMDGSGVIGLIYSQNGSLVQRFSDGLFYAPGENSLYWDTEWFTPSNWPGKVACSDAFYEPTRYETQIELPPGAYQLKVGLWNGRKFGRADLPLTVDRYVPTRLAIGGLALVRKVGPNRRVLPRSLADQFPPLVAKGIEFTPIEDTQLQKGNPLYFYLQVYEPPNAGSQQPSTLLHLQILDAKTGKIVEQPQPLNAGLYATPEDSVIPVVSGVDITKLAKGSYELQAQATDSTNTATPWQSAFFTVEK